MELLKQAEIIEYHWKCNVPDVFVYRTIDKNKTANIFKQ